MSVGNSYFNRRLPGFNHAIITINTSEDPVDGEIFDREFIGISSSYVFITEILIAAVVAEEILQVEYFHAYCPQLCRPIY